MLRCSLTSGQLYLVDANTACWAKYWPPMTTRVQNIDSASRWRVLEGHNGSIGGESQKSRSSSIYYIAPPPPPLLDPCWTLLCTYNTCTTYSFPVFIQRQRTQCRGMLGKVYCTPSPPSSSPLSASRWPCWNIIESPPPYITVYVTQADICCL